jgi:hypothetical protein
MDSPAIELIAPSTVRRRDVARRLLALPLLGVAGLLSPWLFALAYAVVPMVAALHLATDGPERFRTHETPRLAAGLAWLLGVQAWSCLLADRLPLRGQEEAARIRAPSRTPPGAFAAAARLVTGLPGAAVVVVLGAAALPAWIATIACALVAGRPPAPLRGLLAAGLAVQARFLVVHASLGGRPWPRFRPRRAPWRPRRARSASASSLASPR